MGLNNICSFNDTLWLIVVGGTVAGVLCIIGGSVTGSAFFAGVKEAALEEKYEIAYGNWMWMGGNAFSFVRERMCKKVSGKWMRCDPHLIHASQTLYSVYR